MSALHRALGLPENDFGQDSLGYPWDPGVRLSRFTPVEATVNSTDATDFAIQVADLARDLINQGGLTLRRIIRNEDPWE